MLGGITRSAPLLLSVLLASVLPASATAAIPRPLRFRVSLSGSASWATTYHSTPPNQGGNPDVNDGHDSSSETWALRFLGTLSLPRCLGRARCAPVTLSGATGLERATGSIYHHHRDGLYRFDDYTETCRVSAATARGQRLSETLLAEPVPGRRALSLTLADPLTDVLLVLPSTCPGQGDSLDGFPDNMFTPGFSFASGWGPDRWFARAGIFLGLHRLRAGHRIVLPLAPAPSALPPSDCAVPYPSYQRCTTGGSWSARLTLTRIS